MAARLEAMGLNGVRTHFSLEGTLPWILAEGQDPETGYCVALCFTPLRNWGVRRERNRGCHANPGQRL